MYQRKISFDWFLSQSDSEFRIYTGHTAWRRNPKLNQVRYATVTNLLVFGEIRRLQF